MFKILVVDDMMATREGLSAILKRVRGVEEVYCSEGNDEDLEILRKKQINLALVDLQLGWNNGITYGRKLLRYNPNLKVIIYTKEASIVMAAEIFRHDQATVFQTQNGFGVGTPLLNWPARGQSAMRNNSSLHGYILLKNMTPYNLEHYFNIQQGRVLDPELQALLVERLSLLVLTPRERECSELIVQAKSNQEIAAKLGISKQAVENLINSLYNKLSIGGEPKDPGRRVMLALTMQRWRGLDQDQLAVS